MCNTRDKTFSVSSKKKPSKAYIGAFVNPKLKQRLQEISREQHRSLNSQVAIFLAEGVAHLNQVADAGALVTGPHKG